MSLLDDLDDALTEAAELREAREDDMYRAHVIDTLGPALRDAVLEATEELPPAKVEKLAKRVLKTLGVEPADDRPLERDRPARRRRREA